MKILFPVYLALALLLFITSCEKKTESNYSANQDISADTTWNLTSSRASDNASDSNRSFRRKADLKFQVKNAGTASNHIEKLIISNGGFITKSHLRSENVRSRTVPVSNDSVLKLTQYYLVNDLDFRIPVKNLHSTLLAIGEYANFIDYRIIEAEDKTWDIYRNSKYQKRLQTHSKRLENKIHTQKDKIIETTDALNQLLNEEVEMDNTETNQQILADEIAYSTVKINFYEKDQLIKEYEPSENFYSEFKPGFIQQASYNFMEGIQVAGDILLFFLRIWPLLAIITITILFYLKLKS